MIDFIEGKIDYLDQDYITVSTSGIGYRIFCPNPYAFAHCEGEHKRLFTHQHVRDDAIHLYGFASREERDMFRRLLDVSGIGPRGAVAILSAASPEQIINAIQTENISYLTKFPGVGKKTAQRMIIDLKDKLKGITPAALTVSQTAASTQSVVSDGFHEALEALLALGYSETELYPIKAKLREQADAGVEVEQLIKQGLSLLMRG